MKRFDLKFGPELLETVPSQPGVYRFLDAAGVVVYVGQAGDQKRRLAQYRHAGTTRRGKKPHRIMRDATSLEWQTHESELEASLEEIRLIQLLKPKHNVVGAFDFLYPFVGVGARPTVGRKKRCTGWRRAASWILVTPATFVVFFPITCRDGPAGPCCA